MKKFFVLTALAVVVLAGSIFMVCACDNEVDGEGTGGGVYVCTGKGASVYHCRRDCGALKNCDGQIVFTSSPGSQYKSACKRCYK